MIEVVAKHPRRTESQTFHLTGTTFASEKEVKEHFERVNPRYKVEKVTATAKEFAVVAEEVAQVVETIKANETAGLADPNIDATAAHTEALAKAAAKGKK